MLQLVAFLQSWADQAQLNITITIEYAYAFIGLISTVGISGFTALLILTKEKPQKTISKETGPEVLKEIVKEEADAVPTKAWSERLTKGLASSREGVWGKLGNIFGRGGLDDDALEEIEELLYGADLGPKATSELIEELEERAKSEDFNEAKFKSYIKSFLKSISN